MHLRTLGAAIAAALPALATAQNAPQATTLPTVTVTDQAGAVAPSYNPLVSSSATKGTAPLRDIPQTVNVVGPELIADQGVRSLTEALQNVPGVMLNMGDGQRDQVVIRGFTAIGDTFLDGVRDDALYFRDLSNTERIEVIKGPAAVLYGRGSSGGIINRVSKMPTKQAIREITVQFDSEGQKRASFDLGGGLGEAGHSFRLTGAFEDSDGFRDESFIKREAIAPSLSLNLGENTKLLLQIAHNRDRRPTDFGIPDNNGRPLDVDHDTYYGSGNAERDDETNATMDTATATLTHRLNDSWSLRNVLRYYDFKLDRDNTLYSSRTPYTLVGGQLFMQRTHGNVVRDEDGWFNQFELTQRVKLGDVQHTLLYGLELSRQEKGLDNINWAGIDRVPLLNPGGAIPPYARTAPTSRSLDNVTDQDSTALYVQDQIAFGEQWKALVGVRYDEFRQETKQPGQRDFDRTDREWSPRAGLVWQPDAVQSYYVSVSRSFQPSAEQFQLTASNADADPEISTNYEVGAKWDFLGGALSAGASVFRLERDDMKITDPISRLTINAGKQRTDGFELSLSGRPAQGWQIHAGYAFLDTEIVESTATEGANFGANNFVRVPIEGKDAALTPRHSGSLWVMRDLALGWRVGGGVRAQSSQYAAPGAQVRLPGFAVVDAALLYRGKTYDLAFNLKNVFDREYWASAHGSVNGLNQPGAPRTLQATATYRF
ncbi:MAG: TonB-dependent siderophore receptor [Aromatoleum sp.]|jgi:catecholate siderophore receptor|uniref:TonB-dependent receptor n=1 Tax=Aromatoleum sp. TaxID=2307007 RepID=UPI0028959CAD|nr:TonB-dependent siderophore receptor [Aromatoleum sp.]MDT3671976.1 TonB-dependent siderophore receptor [Aromatoleum sp.]